jgi:DNA (cytosine-5)-methyltransferase 1
MTFDSLIIDNFAGGGGASTGIEAALGRPIDVAINHDAEAVAMHRLNHPRTFHYCQDVWAVDPVEVVRAASARRGHPGIMLPVLLAWFSPDCKHFSKAKGGKPVEKGIRDLAWVVVKWAKAVRPLTIMLENVEEFQSWGPLFDDHRPDPKRRGETFALWITELRKLGYRVEFRELRACDYGAPTIRKRLFLVARCDGVPIAWPEATHGKPDSPGVLSGTLAPWRTAAQCIDWSIPCPSIFERERPLAEATHRRIARGIRRYVIERVHPFIVPITHTGDERCHAIDEPLRTVTGAHRGEHALIVPSVMTNTTGHPGAPTDAPLPTIATGGHHALVAPHLVGVGGRAGQSRPRGVDEPTATQTAKYDTALVAPIITRVDQASAAARNGIQPIDDPLRTVDTAGGLAIATPFITKFRAGATGSGADEPVPTVTANSFVKRAGGAPPLGLVAPVLVPRYGERPTQDPRALPADGPMPTVVPTGNGASLVAAFLAKHYGGHETPGAPLEKPADTITAKDHHALVAANLINLKGSERGGWDAASPSPTQCSGGFHIAEVRAFLIKYYGADDQAQDLLDPMHTLTAKARLGLVTVPMVDGSTQEYQIVDIGMRMLSPRELFRAQGFPDSYIIDFHWHGRDPSTGRFARRRMTKTAQVKMCGNSVCPPMAEALVRANLVRRAEQESEVA